MDARDHAFSVADRGALLSEGRLIAQGAPAEVLTSEALKAVYGVSVSLVKLDGGRTLTAPDYDSGRVR